MGNNDFLEEILEHHGVKGMKWGVRRYQNPDGTLTDKGKKRVSKQYAKLEEKVGRNRAKNYTDMYVRAHNKAAHDMNNGVIEKYNKAQKEKYGKDFAKRDGYIEGYEKIFDKALTKYMNKEMKEIDTNNKHFKQAQELVKKYDMVSWDDLAKENDQILKDRETYINN